MSTQSGVGRLLLPPSGADFSDSTSIKSAPLMDKSDQTDCSDLSGSHYLTNRHYLSGKSPSVSSDIGPDGRFAGRLRSPSPSPRKITNYPDPPPSIIFKENARLKLMSAVATSTTNLSIGSQSPAYRRRMANIFATLRKSTSRERRKTQCPPATSTSDQLVEATKSDKSGYDRGRSKVFNGSRILDKIRGRSSSRGQKSDPSRDPSLDANAASSAAGSSSTIIVKNVEQTAEKRSSEEKTSVPPPNATSTSDSTISVKYTRSDSTHLSSASSYRTSSGVGTAKEYVTRSSRTASASNVFSK
uniref:Uncharacterized protein n=1 Tax=Romanomermis culicivorax TaxID=13658 RepID=A0A915L842_ROMCU